jgi:tetratricopeptide (TPR) repeat protein
MRARGLIALLVSLLLTLPPAAWAQAGASSREKRAAAARFQTGRSLYEQGRWTDALGEFQSGYELYPLPGFLINIGQCYRKLERLEEARDAWQKFVDSSPADPRLRSEVEEALAEVRGQLEKRDAEEARRRNDEEQKRRSALLESIARDQRAQPRVDLNLHATPAVATTTASAEVHATPPGKKSRWWVWTIVGVLAAGAAAGAITVGLLYGQNQGPQPGSLGILDGRR